MIKRLAPGLALSACSFLLTLGALEIVARRGVFDNPRPRSTRVESKASSPLEQPNFRNRAALLARQGDDFRILVVGDSFAWGDGVHPEDTFAMRLETRLDAVSRGPDFEVINWSRPGWNTVMEYRSVEANIDEISPDLLLLAFVLNDAEPFNAEKVAALRVGLVDREPRLPPSAYLYRHSRFYSMIWDRLENTRKRRAYTAYYPSLFEGPDWKACLRALESFRDLTRERSIPMVLIVFPIFDSPMDDSYGYGSLHDRMREVAESLGIPVLDLMEAYRGVNVYRLAVVPFTDAHPNELAHRIAADATLDFLARGRLVPRLDYVPERHRSRWGDSREQLPDKDDGAP
jgi:hypothetical protein